MNRFRSRVSLSFGFLVMLLFCLGCEPSEDEARAKIEEKGCTDVTVTRDEDASNMFSYTATCGDQKCMGFLTLGGSTTSSSHTCFGAAGESADASEAKQKAVEGPGKVIIGEGGVTGPCDRAKTRAVLDAKLPELKGCYDKDLQKHPNLMGTLTMVWNTDTSGKTTVSEVESDLDLVDCMRGVIARADWEKPREGTCMTRWSIGTYTKEMPADLGHARYPRMEACPNPVSFAPAEGEELIPPKEFDKKLEGTYELVRMTLWTAGADEAFTAVSDNYGDANVDARNTLMCHTQDLHYTTTVTTDKDGNETTTKELAEDDSTTLNGSASLPDVFVVSSSEVLSTRSFQVNLKNGKFFTESGKSDAEDSTMKELFDDLADNKMVPKSTVIRSANGNIKIAFLYEQDDLKLAVEGIYQKKQ